MSLKYTYKSSIFWSTFSNIFSETTGPIELKFHMNTVHMTNMATYLLELLTNVNIQANCGHRSDYVGAVVTYRITTVNGTHHLQQEC